ncbi:MAG: TrkH family potassium uptake protein [Thermoguttaceae bacterium]
MNYPFVLRQLSAVCIMIGCCMLVGIPWSFPIFGGIWEHESRGVFGLLVSVMIAISAAFVLWYASKFFKKEGIDLDYFSKREAVAVVGLSWVLAAILGGLPYLIGEVHRKEGIPMSVCDAFFEAQSGFTTTGSTVFGELERPDLLPRSILFWRCMTHFLGGMGIVVLFVALLGYGAGTKSIIRSEMSGLSKSSPKERAKQLAMIVFGIYLGLIAVLATILWGLGLNVFDSIYHSVSTMSTGGFSSYNSSAGHFASHGYIHAAEIEWVLILFMFFGGTNFILLYWLFQGKPERLFNDTEWRTYLGIIVMAIIIIWCVGLLHHSFDNIGTDDLPFYTSKATAEKNSFEKISYEKSSSATKISESIGSSSKRSAVNVEKRSFPENEHAQNGLLQHDHTGLNVKSETSEKEVRFVREEIPAWLSFRVVTFQVVSLITTTGLCTDEFEKWPTLAGCVIIILMFVGGCAGATSGGIKVVRIVALTKMAPNEIEWTYRPNVVRQLSINGTAIEKETAHRILIHLMMAVFIFAAGTFILSVLEPAVVSVSGGTESDRQLFDIWSAVLSCISNVGPGFGVFGARQNFGDLTEISKFILSWIMLLGRLEIFVVLALFHIRFWSNHS